MYRSKRLEIALLFSLSFCAGLLFASLLAVTAFVFIHAFVGRERESESFIFCNVVFFFLLNGITLPIRGETGICLGRELVGGWGMSSF